MPQDFEQLFDNVPTAPEDTSDPQDAWVRVYPIFVRTILNGDQFRYTDTLVYAASTLDKATDWCQRNTDVEVHNDESWWWFVITQEAIDGEYSGIKGVMTMLDWDAKPIHSQPLKGYKKPSNEKTDE